jgi:hypothetical protein
MSGRKLTLDPVDENAGENAVKRTGPRLCDLSADELKKLWQRPSADDMKGTMETLARLAFQLRGKDADRQRRILKALKTVQEIQNMDDCN